MAYKEIYHVNGTPEIGDIGKNSNLKIEYNEKKYEVTIEGEHPEEIMFGLGVLKLNNQDIKFIKIR